MALGVLLVMPAQASVGDAFDNQGQRPSATNECYTAKNGAKLCVQFIRQLPHIRTASVLHVGDDYASTIFTNCDTGLWETYGPISQSQGELVANAICN